MFNHKSDYALNKKDTTAIVYQDANGNLTRVTVDDFSSVKEFRKWKNWMNMKGHSEEKRNHIYRNHTVSLTGLEEVIPAVTSMDFSFDQVGANTRDAQEHILQIQQIKDILTKTQFKRIWMYHAEGKNTYEIAKIEGTCHQAISQSLRAAEKKLLSKLKKA